MLGNVWIRRALAAALFAAPVAFFGLPFVGQGSQHGYLPGPTSSGHHQIEERCAECHTRFEGAAEKACLRCHGESLRARNDSHAASKFDDPGKAAQLAVVDARSCLPCHREHRPEARARGSLTTTTTFCVGCHDRIGEERPSHEGLAADGCATAGCHNYHDNRALYRDFLAKHLDEPALLPDPKVPVPPSGLERPVELPPVDAPEAVTIEPTFNKAVADWQVSAHARAKVTCGNCHQAAPETQWRDQVADTVCAGCHQGERTGFLAGKHGMRTAAQLTAMTPGQAHLPMRAAAEKRELGCTSCHGAHLFERRRAAVEACEGCHDDAHTRAYRGSAHELAWQRELAGEAPAGSGVSCATCHLPRRVAGDDVVVEHDQNANLRPADRMLRPVCLSCHGAGFGLSALSDHGLMQTNFTGRPNPAVRTGMDLIKETRNAK
jgi:predicted CXXCH cytochrome family protein